MLPVGLSIAIKRVLYTLYPAIVLGVVLFFGGFSTLAEQVALKRASALQSLTSNSAPITELITN